MNHSIATINQMLETGFTGVLGIVVNEISDGNIIASAPITENSLQPAGIVHGGVYLSLAESMAGLGSILLIDAEKYHVFGIQVSANHTASAREGDMKIVTTCIHRGSKTHIWSVDVLNKDKLLSSARVTNMIVKKS